MKKVFISIILLLLLLTNGMSVGANDTQDRRWQDETIYSIVIDRFYNADHSNDFDVNMDDPNAYHGGDFRGIIEKLDYIKDMGFTTILLSTVFDQTDGDYYGAGVKDFYGTDEHFGTIEDFKRLIDEAHKRDLKVVIDFVFNVDPNHPWRNDSTKQGWLVTSDNDMLQINLENSDARQYIFDVAKWWIEETELDGYRILSADRLSNQFLYEFSQNIKPMKASFYLMWESQVENADGYLEIGMDGFTNYRLSQELRNVFHKPDHSFTTLFSQIDSIHNPYAMATYIDNEQMSRFTRLIIEQNEHPGPRWKQALTFLYTTPGVPIVFYGSEIALDGGGTPDNLRQMNFRTDPELMDYITKIGDVRSKLPSLTRGNMEVLYEKDGFSIHKREYEDEVIVIAINNTTKTQTASIPAEKLSHDMELRGLLKGDLVRSNSKEYAITINRDESEIYTLQEKTGLNKSFIIATALVPILFGVFLYLVWRKSRKQQV
ncbi:alpha-amylase family glycosyl hydrolase [Niallia sp. XMNu-256]|uniref:alpha-amylase family glycosyl hydrolase n=1 Tax=Niallia sp. XMNu-256 TaxID=3082444 RepID=UPI0030CB7A6D